jgi:thiamine biosynthesis protein ThiS
MNLTLTLNGETRSFAGPLSVAGLLAALGLDSRKIAVERNKEIVPRSSYAATELTEGDSLEIVHFIGGG